MVNSVFEFAEFESFYRHFKPLTPYGRDAKAQRRLSHSVEALQVEYDRLEQVMACLPGDSAAGERIEYHLKKIPRLNTLEKRRFETADIFLVKKFLNHYAAIAECLAPDIKDHLDFIFESQDLFALVNLDAGHTDTFYLSEQYSEQLAAERRAIKTLDEQMQALKHERLELLRNACSLDFRWKPFLVLKEDRAVQLDTSLVFLEPFDAHHVIVKPVFPDEYFRLHAQKEQHLQQEQTYEQEVLERISQQICKERQHITEYIESVQRLDLLLAKARVCTTFQMTRPALRAHHGSITVKAGRFLPLFERCQHLETTYYPLNVNFEQQVIVISGSNMGGKTVLLQSIAFFQLLAQMGFFVPAEYFETVVFEHIHYIGEQRHESVEGLSSFGLEMFRFMNAYEDITGKTLYLIDEFARTTNSHEARALISAILNVLTEHQHVYGFLSTHFMELPKLEHLAFYRMKGLNEEAYRTYFQKDAHYDLVERIRLTNSFMEYNVVPDTERHTSRDALKIAQILGLDQHIIHYAEEYLGIEH